MSIKNESKRCEDDKNSWKKIAKEKHYANTLVHILFVHSSNLLMTMWDFYYCAAHTEREDTSQAWKTMLKNIKLNTRYEKTGTRVTNIKLKRKKANKTTSACNCSSPSAYERLTSSERRTIDKHQRLSFCTWLASNFFAFHAKFVIRTSSLVTIQRQSLPNEQLS